LESEFDMGNAAWLQEMGSSVLSSRAGSGNSRPVEDNDFVEVIGGVHPIHGPWVVDHDFVEVIGGIHPYCQWVEYNQQAVNKAEMANKLWQELFGEMNGDLDNQGNAPVDQ
jgi:hypothetical protein